MVHPSSLCVNFEGNLYDLSSAAKKLNCSKEHVLALVEDGELEYIDLARPGSKHRELRFTEAQLDAFARKRTRRMAANSQPKSTAKTKLPGGGSFAEQFRAKQRGRQ